MQREPSITETVIVWGATLLFWLFIINAVATALAVVMCLVGYVIWIALLKPIGEMISSWGESSQPPQPPVQRTDTENTILAICIMTAILVPLGSIFCLIFLPLGILIWIVWVVAMLALFNPNNLFG